MVDDLLGSQGSGDPVIAEESRRLQAQKPRPAQESRGQGCLSSLAVGLAVAGPFTALVAAMSGDEVLVLTITVVPCGLAGLSLAAVSRGIRGALTALALPLIWVVVAAGLVLSIGGVDELLSAELIGLVVGFVLIQAASAEAGYLIGRLVASLIRRPTTAASAR